VTFRDAHFDAKSPQMRHVDRRGALAQPGSFPCVELSGIPLSQADTRGVRAWWGCIGNGHGRDRTAIWGLDGSARTPLAIRSYLRDVFETARQRRQELRCVADGPRKMRGLSILSSRQPSSPRRFDPVGTPQVRRLFGRDACNSLIGMTVSKNSVGFRRQARYGLGRVRSTPTKPACGSSAYPRRAGGSVVLKIRVSMVRFRPPFLTRSQCPFETK
jgi:hypothetical protein